MGDVLHCADRFRAAEPQEEFVLTGDELAWIMKQPVRIPLRTSFDFEEVHGMLQIVEEAGFGGPAWTLLYDVMDDMVKQNTLTKDLAGNRELLLLMRRYDSVRGERLIAEEIGLA